MKHGADQAFVVRLPADLHTQVRDAAAATDLSMAQLVRAALRRYLADDVGMEISGGVLQWDGRYPDLETVMLEMYRQAGCDCEATVVCGPSGLRSVEHRPGCRMAT